MAILTKAEIETLLDGFYPALSADDIDDIRDTLDAMRAALEAWVDCFDIPGSLLPSKLGMVANAIELTKAAGIEWPDG